ncbi:class I SAM-dependent methyltransferase [Evansella sp. LMS18]|uniref:class I SAM-dependent methyltransferase n=1 Tax=Evansella sp. LMS18 TaxID=2924033 RepID=UPI0020D1B4FD|nr:class I SAM-dependent methyltransferase [Evansella sp. LMS18]UTR10280.1 class I SAM-dependent methyltransferase [Evansella sp. LMS18]
MAKWFPAMYDRLMSPLEKRKFRQIRRKLVGKSKGNVLEIGSGTGLNFPYYNDVNGVVAIEPDQQMREISLERAEAAQVQIAVISADGQALPFEDNTFDSVVATLVFCTIPDPEKALLEMRRVCKPEGDILFFEHVRAKNRLLQRLQDLATPLWKRICDGCHLNRDTLSEIKKTGLKVTRIEKHNRGIFLVIEAVN